MSTDGQPEPESTEPTSDEPTVSDPRDLVHRMMEAGEWPHPDLLAEIVAAGDEAVEPLLEILRSRPRGWPDEAPLVNAIGLLSEIGSRTALRELAAVARDYVNETVEDVGLALERFGPEAFDALVGLVEDPAVAGYQRCTLIDSARAVAGEDPARRRRLADAVRLAFTQVMARAKDAQEFEKELVGESEEGPGDEIVEGPSDSELDAALVADLADIATLEDDDLTETENRSPEEARAGSDSQTDREFEAAQNEMLTREELGFLADDLSRLADPGARPLIQAAFAAGLIDESIINLEDVDKDFEKAEDLKPPVTSWLDDYRDFYEDHMKHVRGLERLGPVEFPSRTSYPSFEPIGTDPRPAPAHAQRVEPIRHAGPKIGRNDPCWCGSGKKYKKCHWGKDGQP